MKRFNSLLLAGLTLQLTSLVFAQEKPNMIYIMVDDLGYGDLSCFGQTAFETPNIDQLAIEGIKFTDYHSGNTVCRPSRLALWTGIDPRHAPIIGNQAYAMQDSDVTVGELLKEAGYTTGGVGKWAMFNGEEGHPNDHGYDFWMGYLNQSNAHNFYPPYVWRNHEKVPLGGNLAGPTHEPYRGRVANGRETYSHDVMTEEALGFIRRNANGPFLLHVHWTIPHANNEGGRAWQDGMEVPSYGEFENKDWPNPEKGFAAMITHMDRDVGRIMALLKELNIDNNTLVIFTSDNGPHHEGNHDHAFFDSNGPLKGYKRDLYEGGIRVPMLARWPGKIKAGTKSSFTSAFWDWLPTACELAGVDAPDNIDGTSLLPAFIGETEKRRTPLFWKFGDSTRFKVAVRSGNWKAIKNTADGAWELYDLSTDLGEENDLAAKNPEMLAGLVHLLEED
ncbi:MAG: arylsulfatase [Verrucomicrobia bacterium]|nr:arylsulfatase [Verrucomicrobiota bacterium]